MAALRAQRTSDYGLQLREKQKVKRMYGVLEKSIPPLLRRSRAPQGQHWRQRCCMLLESRLDNVVYRMGYGSTRAEARQMVSHKSITVNGQVVNIPSFTVKAGDVVAVREKAKKQLRIIDALKLADSIGLPAWVSVDLPRRWKATVQEGSRPR